MQTIKKLSSYWHTVHKSDWSIYTAPHKDHPNPPASEVREDPHLKYLTFTTPSPNFIQIIWWISHSTSIITYQGLVLQYAFSFHKLCSEVSQVKCKKVFICIMESGIWIRPLRRRMNHCWVGILANLRLWFSSMSHFFTDLVKDSNPSLLWSFSTTYFLEKQNSFSLTLNKSLKHRFLHPSQSMACSMPKFPTFLKSLHKNLSFLALMLIP